MKHGSDKIPKVEKGSVNVKWGWKACKKNWALMSIYGRHRMHVNDGVWRQQRPN